MHSQPQLMSFREGEGSYGATVLLEVSFLTKTVDIQRIVYRLHSTQLFVRPDFL